MPRFSLPPMKVALVTSSMPLAPWQNGITRAFSEAGLAAEVVPWEGRHPRSAIGARYALVWLPPAQLFEVEHDLEVVFNLGAGVDRLLANAVVPERLPIVRLVDAGMAARMAEYVCFAIARATRGLERFGFGGLRDWNASRPRGKPPTVGVLGAGAIGSKIAEAAAMFDYPVRVWSRTSRTFEKHGVFRRTRTARCFPCWLKLSRQRVAAHKRHREPARPRAFVEAA